MTLYSIWPIFCVISPTSVALGANNVKVVDVRPILSRQNRSPKNLVFGNICSHLSNSWALFSETPSSYMYNVHRSIGHNSNCAKQHWPAVALQLLTTIPISTQSLTFLHRQLALTSTKHVQYVSDDHYATKFPVFFTGQISKCCFDFEAMQIAKSTEQSDKCENFLVSSLICTKMWIYTNQHCHHMTEQDNTACLLFSL